MQVGIPTLIHRAMVVVNQQEAVVGATVLGGIGRQRAEEATMSMIIAIATNMTMTDTTIPILMQGEVTQLAIMTTTILMTSIRVENLMESEDSDLWVRRCLHPTPILSSSRIGRIRRRRRKGVIGNNNTMTLVLVARSISDRIGNCSNRDARRWSARDKPVCIRLGEGKIDALFRQTFAHGERFCIEFSKWIRRAMVCVRV